MRKNYKTAALLLFFIMLSAVAYTQPPPPPSGSGTAVPLDPAAFALLAGAAIMRVKSLPVWKRILG